MAAQSCSTTGTTGIIALTWSITTITMATNIQPDSRHMVLLQARPPHPGWRTAHLPDAFPMYRPASSEPRPQWPGKVRFYRWIRHRLQGGPRAWLPTFRILQLGRAPWGMANFGVETRLETP